MVRHAVSAACVTSPVTCRFGGIFLIRSALLELTGPFGWWPLFGQASMVARLPPAFLQSGGRWLRVAQSRRAGRRREAPGVLVCAQGQGGRRGVPRVKVEVPARDRRATGDFPPLKQGRPRRRRKTRTRWSGAISPALDDVHPEPAPGRLLVLHAQMWALICASQGRPYSWARSMSSMSGEARAAARSLSLNPAPLKQSRRVSAVS